MFNQYKYENSENNSIELEIVEFTVCDKSFGINVAKISEIMQYQKINPMPNSNPHVEGIFKSRNKIITVVNLASYMGLECKDQNNLRDILIITNFNKIVTAFHVHTVEAIHKISWSDIKSIDATVYSDADGLATGIASFENNLITIIDFEKIVTEISKQKDVILQEIRDNKNDKKILAPIFIIEDSNFLMDLLTKSLHKAGYENLVCCVDGKEAWAKLQKIKELDGPVQNHVACIITDIEMPQMDGHTLVKLIRSEKKFHFIPVIIFSSLITDEIRNKGIDLGVTHHISKPEINTLVEVIDEFIL